MTTIHARLKRLRAASGLSMQALAAAVGLRAWQAVQQWENGETAPRRDRLFKRVAHHSKAIGLRSRALHRIRVAKARRTVLARPEVFPALRLQRLKLRPADLDSQEDLLPEPSGD